MTPKLERLIQLHSFAVWLEANGHWYFAEVIRTMIEEER